MRKINKKFAKETILRRYKRKLRIRKKINGTSDRPRVCISKSNKHLFVQVIDDSIQKTLLSTGTFGKNKIGNGANTTSAKEMANGLALKMKDKGISKIVFDRNGRSYNGVIKEFAENLRLSGVVF